MIYFKANGTEHPASIDGKLVDRDWNGRESKEIGRASCRERV